MANIFFIVVACILLFIQESNAYPSGAGGTCQVETPGVFGPGQFGEPSPHASDLDIFDWLDNPFAFLLFEYGLEVQLDGVPMVDAYTDFAVANLYDPNVPHEISVVASDGSPFKGVLLRAESLFLEDVSGALLPTDSTLQDLAICADQFAVGLTHTDSSDKQRVDAVFEYVPFDKTDIVIFEVTVVVNTLEWYYAPFLLAILDVTAEPTLSPTLEPTLNPTDAPSPDPTGSPSLSTSSPVEVTLTPTNAVPIPGPTISPIPTEPPNTFVCRTIEKQFNGRVQCDCDRTLLSNEIDCAFEETKCRDVGIGTFCSRPSYEMSTSIRVLNPQYKQDMKVCANDLSFTDSIFGIQVGVQDICISFTATLSYRLRQGFDFSVSDCIASFGNFECNACQVCSLDDFTPGVTIACEGGINLPCFDVPIPVGPLGSSHTVDAFVPIAETSEIQALVEKGQSRM